MTETINYLRRCADNKVLEASLTPEMCREIVQMIDHLEAERDAALAELERARDSAHGVRAAAASMVRRRPLYDGASGESAEEELAQAIEDIQLPDAYVTNWRTDADRLSALDDVSAPAANLVVR